jgi:hypothetical protein
LADFVDSAWRLLDEGGLIVDVMRAWSLLEGHDILVLDLDADVALLLGRVLVAGRAAIDVGLVEDGVEGLAGAGGFDHFVDELFVVHIDLALETLDFGFDVVVVVEF